MKQLLVSLFFFLLFNNITEAQQSPTFAGPPGPDNVLVVYSSNSDTSLMVANYYKTARGIPASNIIGLDNLSNHDITIGGVMHPVIIAEQGNIIRDELNHEWGTWYATQHAWKYFYQYIAAPIKQHIAANNLNSIRYIVLCKAVPFKIQAGADSSKVICNLTVGGLLSMLNTDNYDILLDSIYNKFRRNAIPDSTYCYDCQRVIFNPYYGVDPNLTMDNRFIPGAFTRTWNGHTIKLDYLVSHLDGINFDMVKGIIDRSIEAIHATNYDWFIDADPSPCLGGDIMMGFANTTASKFSSLGFSNYFINTTEDTVTFHNKPVMSYSSNGVHTSLTSNPNHCQNFAFAPDYI